MSPLLRVRGPRVLPLRVLGSGALAWLLGATQPACTMGDGMQEKLRDATSGYNRNLRWGDHDRAAEYLPRASRSAFLQTAERLRDDLVIVDYQISRLDLEKQRGVASCRALISWHTDRRLIVEETVVDQTWQWHDGQFVLVDERRVSGTPLALFHEAPTDPSTPKTHPYLPGLENYRSIHGIGKEERAAKHRRGSRKRTTEGTPATQATQATQATPATQATQVDPTHAQAPVAGPT